MLIVVVIALAVADSSNSALQQVGTAIPVVTVELHNYLNEYYTGKFYIGSPTQQFDMIFDLGSSYIWIPGTGSHGFPTDHPVYDEDASSTYVSLNQSFTIDYIDQNVTGDWSLEDFTIGDEGKVVAKAQPFVVVKDAFGFSGLKADGIVGLGIQSQDDNHKTLIETLSDQKLIKNNIFSLFLNDNRYEKDDRRKPKSMLMIGGYDLDKYSNGADVHTYDIVNNTGLWSIKLDSISCKDTEIDTESSYAVLDSRYPKIIGPNKSVKKLFDRFEAMYGCGYYYSRMVCDCSEIYSIVSFPPITLKIDGDDYTFHEGSYFKKTSKACFLMFEGADIDYWILGQPFLRKYYSIYDIENLQVKLVEAVSSRFTVDTDSNWWIIPVVLIIGAAGYLFAWLGWVYYKKYSGDSKLLVEQEARG